MSFQITGDLPLVEVDEVDEGTVADYLQARAEKDEEVFDKVKIMHNVINPITRGSSPNPQPMCYTHLSDIYLTVVATAITTHQLYVLQRGQIHFCCFS